MEESIARKILSKTQDYLRLKLCKLVHPREWKQQI